MKWPCCACVLRKGGRFHSFALSPHLEQEVYLLTSLTSLSIGTLLVVCASLHGTHTCVLLVVVFDLQLAMTL